MTTSSIHPFKKFVEICWQDASSTTRWRDIAEYNELTTPVQCRTVGYVLKENKRFISVVQTQGDHDMISNSMTIPRDWVMKIRRLH